MVAASRILGHLFESPVEGGSHRLPQHGPTGFADGRQLGKRPFLCTVLLELGHEQSVRQHHQVHVPGLALAVAQLTSSHAQLLFSVSMERFRACPTIAVDLQNPNDFPSHAVGYQDLTCRPIALLVPDNHDPHFVVHLGDMDGGGEIPLLLPAVTKRLAAVGVDFRGRLERCGIAISMDGRGRALDNVFIERLWRSVKYEEVYLKDYATAWEAEESLANYFRFYCHDRIHQFLGYRTPAAVYGQGR